MEVVSLVYSRFWVVVVVVVVVDVDVVVVVVEIWGC